MTSSRQVSQYVDARELHPEYTTIPCLECGDEFYVQNSFAYTHDTWYCDACKPEELEEAIRSILPRHDVEVRI